MSKRDVPFLACKILSLYALTLGLGASGTAGSAALSMARQGMRGDGSWLDWLQFGGTGGALYFAAGILLWAFAEPLSAAMVRGQEDSPAAVGGDWRPFSIALLGLWLLISSLPQAAGLVMSFSILRNNIGSGLTTERLIPQAVTVGTQIALGLWLLLGAGGIFRGLRSLRDVGRDATPID